MMNEIIDLGLIRTFLAVVSQGGLKGAAEQLHYTPSAVSMQLKRLEEQLGKRLLERNNQGIVVTDAGHTLRRHGEHLLAGHNRLLTELFEQELQGKLSLGIPTDHARILLDQLLPVFESEFPALEPRLTLEPSRSLRKRVLADEMDVAIVARNPTEKSGRLLWSEDVFWCGDAERANGDLRIGMLSTDCVLTDIAKLQLSKIGRRYEVVLDTASVAALEAAVEANFAVAFLPSSSLSQRVRPSRIPELADLDGFRIEFEFIASIKIEAERRNRIFHRLQDVLDK